eukprot:scaffold635363_cov36-Prasinocladus_malaysianus.AAC.1
MGESESTHHKHAVAPSADAMAYQEQNEHRRAAGARLDDADDSSSEALDPGSCRVLTVVDEVGLIALDSV